MDNVSLYFRAVDVLLEQSERLFLFFFSPSSTRKKQVVRALCMFERKKERTYGMACQEWWRFYLVQIKMTNNCMCMRARVGGCGCVCGWVGVGACVCVAHGLSSLSFSDVSFVVKTTE